MKPLIFFILSLNALPLLCLSQTNPGCDSILKIEIRYKNEDQVRTCLHRLQQCGIDSNDVNMIADKPMFGVIVIGLMDKKKGPLTYGDLLNFILKMKSDPNFERAKNMDIESRRIMSSPVTSENWQANKKYFEKMGLSESYIDSAFALKMQHPEIKWTYKMLFQQFAYEKQSQKNSLAKNELDHAKKEYSLLCDTSKIIRLPGNLLAVADYKTGINCAKNLNRPVIVYFSGYSASNARRIEQELFTDTLICNILKKNFILIDLIVDDRNPLPDDKKYKSEYSGNIVTTVGAQNIDLEQSLFHANFQPLIIILDNNGNTIRRFEGYFNSKTEFLNALKTATK
jgi:thioredoxin-related protein